MRPARLALSVFLWLCLGFGATILLAATVPNLLDGNGPRAWREAERESPQRIPRALLP